MKRFVLSVCCTIAVTAVFLAQDPEGALASLIQAGNRQAALDMIRAGTDVNEAQPDRTRPIHWAVYRVDHELVEALIAAGAEVDVINELGSTPLAEAVRLRDHDMVRMLLDAGAGPEGANPDGQTALMLAVRNGDLELVRTLVEAGADVNNVEAVQDQTPLMWATTAGENAAEMVRYLISEGADVHVRARFTDWPSQITSEPRWQYHAYGGLTALLYAAREGCLECVEALVDAGADVNLPTPEGVTALMIALDNGHNEVGKWLLDHGANPHVWDVYGRTALYVAIYNKNNSGGGFGGGRGGRGGGRGFPGGAPDLPVPAGPEVTSMDMIGALLEAGVDPDVQLSYRRPSNQGGRFGDPNLSTGATPLYVAALNNDREVIEALLDHGANPNIVGMGATPFLLAAGVNPFGRGGGAAADTAVLDLMIEHGADVNAQVTGTLSYSMRISRGMSDDEGISALHSAVQSGNVELVRYLLENGARTDVRDWSGRTPMDVANGVPARPIPPDLATARVPDPYAPTDVENVEDAPVVTGGGRGGPAGPDAAVLAEIRSLLAAAGSNEVRRTVP